MRLILQLALAALGGLAFTAPAASAADLVPFTATYGIEWRGMNAGVAQLKLSRKDGDIWAYESHNNARGLFRMALPGEVTQSTEFRVRDGRIEPLHFVGEDGTSNTDKDVELRFDWKAGRATGRAENEAVDLAIERGTQDGMSVQIALIHELNQGRTPATFLMVDKNVVKDYEYTHEGSETVQTALGPIETQIYRSRRPDSQRGTWFWCAPSYGYVPVKVERRNGRKVDWSISIRKLERGAAQP